LIGRLEHTVYLGEYDDETAEVCRWALPESHPLESWGDCLGDGGHYGVGQPHILPLLGGRSAIEVLAHILQSDEVHGEQIVRRTADSFVGSSLSNRQWHNLLRDGFDAAIAAPPLEFSFVGSADPLTTVPPVALESVDRDNIEVAFFPADGLYDGRFANNGWLQEMPQSLTKLTWDNAAVMNPATAAALGVKHGVMVALTRGESTLELPVFEVPGVATGVVAINYGYGRTRAGAVGGHVELEIDPVGVDVRPLRTSSAMGSATRDPSAASRPFQLQIGDHSGPLGYRRFRPDRN
jgi:hypothetical protein